MMHNTKETRIVVGDVVLIKDEDKNKGKWSIGIMEELLKSKDAMSSYEHQSHIPNNLFNICIHLNFTEI